VGNRRDQRGVGVTTKRDVRVLVVDDHDLYRTGLASLLSAEPGFEVVAQASGGKMGVRLALELRPDIVLMDVRMPDLTGAEATRQITEQLAHVRVLALTAVYADDDVAAMLQAGAGGFLTKDTDVDSVIAAVRAAGSGAAWLSPRAAEAVLGRIRAAEPKRDPEPDRIAQLSPRELDVLRLVAEGMENSAIAGELHISPRTAKNHVSNILVKLGLPSRVQAAVYAVRKGVS
jgi:DNA-binding NarL/FixJ family response regulator